MFIIKYINTSFIKGPGQFEISIVPHRQHKYGNLIKAFLSHA